MAQKPDYYEVLGIDRTATEAEIKKAYQKVVMTCHPDRVKHSTKLSEPEKEKALERFKYATEAEKILTDSTKRTTYDNYGHKGLDNLANGKSSGTGQSWADAAGPVKPKVYDEEDTMSFFENRAERNRATANDTPDDGLTSEQRRERAREERRRNRRGGGDNTSSGSSTPAAPQADFQQAVQNVGDAADKMRSANQNGIAIPLDKLEAFRDNLQDFMKEVDTAIAQAKKPPKNGYNR